MALGRTAKSAAVHAALVAADRLGVNRVLRSVRRRIPVAIMYHGVTDQQRPVGFSRHIPAAVFDSQLATFKKHFDVVTAWEWVQALRRPRPATRKLLTITFDDGYENNLLSAVPILRSHGLTACFFVTTGPIMSGSYLDHDLLELAVLYGSIDPLTVRCAGREGRHALGDDSQRLTVYSELSRMCRGAHWREQIALARDLYRSAGSPHPPAEYRAQYATLSTQQLGNLTQQGMEVGSHTVHHLKLAECEDGDVEAELTGAAKCIHEATGLKVTDQLLAYPAGSYDERVMRIAGSVGHPAAFAVHSDVLPAAETLYQLPRVGLSRGEGLARASAKASGLWDMLKPRFKG